MAVFFEEFEPSKKFLDNPTKFRNSARKNALEFINKNLQPQQIITISESSQSPTVVVWYRDLTIQEIAKL